MVYDSDFYTSRRVGSSYTRPTISSYTVTRRGVNWDKVPFVPRPSLIPDPVTAHGKTQPRKQKHVSILEAINREGIEPDPRILARPYDDYLSPRDRNRCRILNESIRQEHARVTGHKTDLDSMDTVLRRLHGEAPVRQERRHTPRYSTYTTTDVGAPRRDDSAYSYSKTVRSETSTSNSADPYSSRPSTSSSSYSSTSERNNRSGPGGYSYNTERTTTTGGGPAGYSYSSTTSGRLPHGTSYRHYSYRV